MGIFSAPYFTEFSDVIYIYCKIYWMFYVHDEAEQQISLHRETKVVLYSE